jgi:mRNA-degrading endonuclease YafQ of YafQ-DinJ toxin-antitoxin module
MTWKSVSVLHSNAPSKSGSEAVGIWKQDFGKKLKQFTLDPFDPSLKTHKLSGKLKEYWSFSVDYDARVLFYFTEDEKAVFVDIGSCDEVY